METTEDIIYSIKKLEEKYRNRAFIIGQQKIQIKELQELNRELINCIENAKELYENSVDGIEWLNKALEKAKEERA
ncbi:hypothetical protein [Tissierella sp.]|uniref:hypothetical protein n=1 Tax=Tissierella sp. TaxID=41274 RepID=UPI003069636F